MSGVRSFRLRVVLLGLAGLGLASQPGCGGESREPGTVAPSLSSEEQNKVMKESADYYRSNQGQFPP
ncbi:hypothetical protein [Tautonia plasticadhaerens]|uniref:Uncharacterized protein n=1 Tax=Tautonia plasticadhaerens TaxID=2527974 RepID=A0A518H2S5_9BACT|nr:hypothetical protein [Tautonia plasticadhaerens]QDV35134.1 hypothetical protein ElP_30370 [Tautonia plasticadhaerens]